METTSQNTRRNRDERNNYTLQRDFQMESNRG